SSHPEQKTGPDGKYFFDGLFTDAGYSVMAKAPGFGDKYSDRISLTPGKETGVGELKLKHADATLDGTVIDPNGKPVPGVTINGVDTPSQPHTMTDENGVFHLTNLNRGDVHVQVYSNKWFYSSENKFHGGDKNVTLKLIARQEAPAGAVNEPFENMAGKKAAELKASEWINGG